jgi:XTP/dITP diphosphohydrolase
LSFSLIFSSIYSGTKGPSSPLNKAISFTVVLDKKEYLFEGIVEGRISKMAKGQNGFGYDPIFIPENGQNSFAQMSLEEKNKISHRSRAFQKLVEFLKS